MGKEDRGRATNDTTKMEMEESVRATTAKMPKLKITPYNGHGLIGYGLKSYF